MSVYITSPFKPVPQLLVPGTPSYVFGSWNDRTGPTMGQVTFSKTNGTTTATLQFKILSGNIPANGSLITVVGSANSANFNVTNVAIANVTALNSPDDGNYSLTYAITSTATPTSYTADGAQLIIPQPEVGEALAVAASVPVAAAYPAGSANYEKTISVNVKFPSKPTTAVVVLEAANIDLDAEYASIASIVNDASPNPADGQIEVESNFRFYRANVLSFTGGSSPTIVCSIEL